MDVRNFTNFQSFFLNNKTVKQTIFKNTFWLGVGGGISKLLKLFLIIYVARILGATEYGKFTFALAFVSLFVVFSDFGLPSIVTREFAREKEKEKEFYSVLSLKLLLSLGTLILVLIGSLFITPDPAIQKIMLILAIFSSISGFSTLIYDFFKAWQRMEYQAWGMILEALLVIGCGFFVILNFPSIENLSYAYLLSSFCTLIFVLIFFHFKIFPIRVTWQKVIWKKFLAMSWPLALVSLFATLYSYVDSVMMGHLGQINETGWYNAAYKIVNVTLIPMGLISASFFPILSKFFKESKERLQDVWNYQVEIMVIIAFPLVVGGIVLAPKIINFVYGSPFAPSILAFQILTIMAGVIFLYAPLNQILIAANQQKKIFWITLLGALINITLNLILIPKFSLYGAAAATSVTNILVFFMYIGATFKFTSIQLLGSNLPPLFMGASLSSTAMYLVISQPLIYNLNLFLSILIGGLTYVIVLSFLKKIILQPLGYYVKD